MSEYNKQAEFLRMLLAYEESDKRHELQERLEQAQKNERCLLVASRLVGLIAFTGLAGLGYSAVLLPEFFNSSSHVLVQFFSALALGSAMCLVVFVGLWLYYRGALNRVHDECRRVITRMIEARLEATEHIFLPTILEDPDLRIRALRFTAHTASASLAARKAS